MTFLHGKREELEEWYQNLDASLTDARRAHLRWMGIDPESGD